MTLVPLCLTIIGMEQAANKVRRASIYPTHPQIAQPYVISAQEMRDLDRVAMQEGGIPGTVLMENAGRAVADVVLGVYGSPHKARRRVAVVCGAGNNGGDGFVVARLLRLAGYEVSIFIATAPQKITGDALIHYNLLRQFPIPILTAQNEPNGDLATSEFQGYGLIIDALLGTGLNSAPIGTYAHCIEQINIAHSKGVPVVAIDIPSGVAADTGATPGSAVHADHTVTFAFAKRGHFLFPGAAHVGKLHLSDIGWNWKQPETTPKLFLTGCTQHKSWQSWRRFMEPRAAETNKSDYGHVGIVAGSRGMVGASALAAKAAQRCGTGLVTMLTTASAQSTLALKLDEQMTVGLPEEEGSLSSEGWEQLAKFLPKADVLCVGPGLTTAPQTVGFVHRIVREAQVPIVLDADGLNAIAMAPELCRERASTTDYPLILTPHPGEAARLLGTSIPEVQSDRIEAVYQLAKRYQATVVLKGRYSLIADCNGTVGINRTGNPGMATGGMGDTLTGILGGLLARYFASCNRQVDGNLTDVPLHDIVSLGVHLHGIAGDLAADCLGETALIASDVIHHLPDAIQLLEDTLC